MSCPPIVLSADQPGHMIGSRQAWEKATKTTKPHKGAMSVECHNCYEALTCERGALTLQCGHVCCAPCLEPWLRDSPEGQKCCPLCGYILLPGKAPLSISLRFSDSSGGLRPDSPIELDDAVKSGHNLKALLQGLSREENITAHNLQALLDEAVSTHASMKGVRLYRELQELDPQISTQIGAIRKDLPRLREELEEAKHALRAQRTIKEDLIKKLELREQQVELLQTELVGQRREYEAKLEAERRESETLRKEKAELQEAVVAERKDLQEGIEQSEQLTMEMSVAVAKLRLTFPICGARSSGRATKNGTPAPQETESRSLTHDTGPPLPQDNLSPAIENVEARRGCDRSLVSVAIASDRQTTEVPTRLPSPSEVPDYGSSSTAFLAGQHYSLLHKAKPNRRCAKAFVDYYNARRPANKVKVVALPATPGVTMRQATAVIDGHQVLVEGKNETVAERKCYKAICIPLRSLNWGIWEQFVRSPEGRRFSK